MRVLAVAVCGLALASGPANATLYIGPTRPLTRAETVSTTVHEAELIVVGDLVSHRLTPSVPAAVLPYHVRFHARRWLKGDRGSSALDICWWPPPSDSPRGDSRSDHRHPQTPPSGQRFILFAYRPDAGTPAADSCSWFGIHEGPSFFLPAFSAWSQAFEDEVRRTIANQEPEALVLRSDRVVLGTVEREFPGLGVPGPAATFVRVRRAFKGPRTPARLPVRLVDDRAVTLNAVTLNNTRPHLFFLRRTDDGVYEPVELIAGVIPAFGARVPDWDMSVDDALRRIERAVADGEKVRRRAKDAARSK